MPRTCTICAHTDRAAIDAALVAGEAYRHIAQRFAVSVWAVNRHKVAHIPAALALAQDAAEVAHGESLLAQVRELQAKTLSVLAKAETLGDLPTVLKAVREARGNVELLARLIGELPVAPTVNVLVAAPEWLTLRTRILAALEDFPEARAAVVAALGRAGDAGQ